MSLYLTDVVRVVFKRPIFNPPGDGVLFSIDFFDYLFIYLFVCLSARLRENGRTNLHEIFREGVE